MTEDGLHEEPAVFPHPPEAPALATGELLPGAPVLAAPTVDSDLDGAADTTVAPQDDALVLATDLDHDGLADVVTRIGPEGVVTTRHGGPPEERPWGAAPPPAPSVDPLTGQWVRD
ncbi:DUF6802 family protein [Actinomycetospora termitidis]|uniref:DUF6802 domain-containing protein n=1 Tax=Actinomycetospora termitidis TaxID=3053470 RepID=A0ABT7M6D3_9PSEU|nr:DUF6802 family protein [Actinomycetospora sp. Odt1-22]MDL5155023.1 hypothetical protein [Actinomycetospora sp. Odt1-22]